jgi:ABC-type dipeptide/oligopeptide/nickel transport system permease component
VEARSAIADRLAGTFVLAVLAVACLVFWIGVPIGVLWALSKATDDAATHFVSGLLGVPLAMALFSPFLFWLNNLYLRVTGVLDRLAEDEEESGWHRRVRGPLEPMMFLSLAVAIVALCIWFFFIAEDPPRQII